MSMNLVLHRPDIDALRRAAALVHLCDGAALWITSDAGHEVAVDGGCGAALASQTMRRALAKLPDHVAAAVHRVEFAGAIAARTGPVLHRHRNHLDLDLDGPRGRARVDHWFVSTLAPHRINEIVTTPRTSPIGGRHGDGLRLRLTRDSLLNVTVCCLSGSDDVPATIVEEAAVDIALELTVHELVEPAHHPAHHRRA